MQILSYILYIVLAIVILLLMIMIHETGHYIAGKILHFKIVEFSIGFGPKIFKKKLKNGEYFSLRWIPLGGYCAFDGEDEIISQGTENLKKEVPTESVAVDKKGNKLYAFNSQRPWKRIIVLLSGAFLNIISAVIFSIISITVVGYAVPAVNEVYTPNSAVFQSGDEIVSVNGKDISVINTLDELLSNTKINQNIKFEVMRSGVKEELTATKKQYYTVSLNYKIVSIDGKEPKGKDLENSLTSVKLNDTKDIVIERNGIEETITLTRTASGFTMPDGDLTYFDAANNYVVFSHELTGVNGTPAQGMTTLQSLLAQYKDDPSIMLNLSDRGTTFDVAVSKQNSSYNTSDGIAIVMNTNTGVGISLIYSHRSAGFWYAVKYSVPFTAKMAWTILGSIGKLLTGQLALTETLSGPITNFTIIADLASANWRNILLLLPLIAVNLGVFNLLPVPALDGSKVVFCLIEWIRKKPINRNVEAWIHFGGIIFLLGLSVIVEILRFL